MRGVFAFPGKFAAILLAGCVLGGCGLGNLTSVSAPAPSQVADYINEMRAGAALVKDMTPREYLTASIVYSNQKCKEFFVAMSEAQRESKLIDKVLNAATAAGTSLYPVYGASQKGQAVFTAILTGGLGLNDAVREIYTFGPYANELGNKVTESQNAFLGAQSTQSSVAIISEFSGNALKGRLQESSRGHEYSPIPEVNLVININHVTRDEAMLLARYVAQGYAYQCSVANIGNLIRSSIATARIGIGNTGRGGPMSQAVTAPIDKLGNPEKIDGDAPVQKPGSLKPNKNGGGESNSPKTNGGGPKVTLNDPKIVPSPGGPRISGGLSALEQNILLADGVRIQQALCLSKTDGDFGSELSPTRAAIRLFQVTRKQTPTGILSEFDRDSLKSLDGCPAVYRNIYERLTLDVPGKVGDLHVELQKAVGFVQKQRLAKNLPSLPQSVLSDSIGKQTAITSLTRDAIGVVQAEAGLPANGELTPELRSKIKNFGLTDF